MWAQEGSKAPLGPSQEILPMVSVPVTSTSWSLDSRLPLQPAGSDPHLQQRMEVDVWGQVLGHHTVMSVTGYLHRPPASAPPCGLVMNKLYLLAQLDPVSCFCRHIYHQPALHSQGSRPHVSTPTGHASRAPSLSGLHFHRGGPRTPGSPGSRCALHAHAGLHSAVIELRNDGLPDFLRVRG